MSLHPRLSLHQVAMIDRDTPHFIAHCRAIGMPWMTLATGPLLAPGGLEAARAALALGGPRVATLNHSFAFFPNLPEDRGEAAAGLLRAIDAATELGAGAIYLITGGRGFLTWEDAAARFSHLLAPCRAAARDKGVKLLVENANAFNVDIHIAHTLPDTIRLADQAGISLCLDLHACWMEGDLKNNFRRAMPLTGLVQVSDYVLGDRSTPCRAVPGDGAIPLERLLGDLLECGYEGLFDLELVGPRIAAEGAAAATARAGSKLSEMLEKLGA